MACLVTTFIDLVVFEASSVVDSDT